MNQKRLVYRTATLAEMLGVSVPTIWRMLAAKQLPPAFKLSPAQTVWDVAEIDQWLADKKAARFAPAPAPATPVQRGINPVAISIRPDAKRPGRSRKEAT